MARKPIPEQTLTNIFLNSRRRCCLCFWLKGEDEVKKGQIAHIDGDNENAAEGNLVFLCLEHHDDFDSTTRLSKGLREAEVKRWRDELYKEMRYRFRSIKPKTAELSLVGFRWHGPKDECSARFKVKNTGEVELRRVLVSIRLPDWAGGKVPPPQPQRSTDRFGLPSLPSVPAIDLWAAAEERQDLFEPDGRVCVKQFHPFAVLMPGHADEFDALLLHLSVTKPGSELSLEYRIDAEDMQTIRGTVSGTLPTDPNQLQPVE